MAERRMFAKSIIDSDLFLDMPKTAQALYFHLAMRADDDGFLNNSKKIMRMIGATDDDYKILAAKSFILQFPDGICVITHWRLHNYIQKDRYKETIHVEEKSLLRLNESNVYTLDTESVQPVYSLETQVRLGKDRIGKDNNKNVAAPGKNRKPTTFPDDSFEMQCVNTVVQSVLGQFQGAKVPKSYEEKCRWCEHIDKMKRLDHRTEGEIEEALRFATTNQFWKTNIQSTKKLREKFDTIIMQARNIKKPVEKKNQFQSFPQRETDYDAIVMQQLTGGTQ